MDNNMKEIKRLDEVVDMMLTMHCILRDRYKKRAFIIDLMLIVASFLMLTLSFADEKFLCWIGVCPIEALQNGRIFAVVIFIISLFNFRVNWKEKFYKHSRARDELVRLKGETKKIMLNDKINSELLESHRQLCNLTMSGLCPIPENQFNKLKAKHLVKVEVSKMTNFYPGCPIILLRIRLFIKGFSNACRKKKSGKECEKKESDS